MAKPANDSVVNANNDERRKVKSDVRYYWINKNAFDKGD